MECSPTGKRLKCLSIQIVAVPINYGMLSYPARLLKRKVMSVAVPINYGMLSYY